MAITTIMELEKAAIGHRLLGAIRKELERRSPAEVAEAAGHLLRFNKWSTYYPDEGPLRRELYTGHLEFFRASKEHNELPYIGANRIGKNEAAAFAITCHMTGIYPKWWEGFRFHRRTRWWICGRCITPWTGIETDRGERQFREMLGEGGFDVRSWDGGSRCTKQSSPLFLKSIEPAFQIHLDNGATFQCSRKHQILMPVEKAGHQSLEWVSVHRIIRNADGLHCWKTNSDSESSCGRGNDPDGGRSLVGVNNGQDRLPSPAGVPRLCHDGRHEGAVEPIREYSYLDSRSGLQSSLDDHYRIGDLLAHFEDPGDRVSAEWPSAILQELRKFSDGCGHWLASDAVGFHQSGISGFGKCHAGIECRVVRKSGRVSHGRPPSEEQPAFQLSHRPEAELFHSLDLGAEIFFPFDPPELFGGQHIIAIVPVGLQPIVDISVQETQCYEMAGVIHHNTWKECRDLNQSQLLGDAESEEGLGTGMIPRHLIHKTVPNPHIKFGLESFQVKHIGEGISTAQFKVYEQGAEAFEGVRVDGVWLDELCPLDIYTACKMRTANTHGGKQNGLIMLTFTPLQGLTDLVLALKERAANRDALEW